MILIWLVQRCFVIIIWFILTPIEQKNNTSNTTMNIYRIFWSIPSMFSSRSSSINASYTSIARSFQCLSSSTCMWTKNRDFLLFFLFIIHSKQKNYNRKVSIVTSRKHKSMQINMFYGKFPLTSCDVDVLVEFHNRMHSDHDLKVSRIK